MSSWLALLLSSLALSSGLPTPQDDFVITSAEEPREGRLLISDTPLDRTNSDVASFRLPLASQDPLDEVVVVEAADYDEPSPRSAADIPRDTAFGIRAGPRLPLPVDDVVVVGENDGGQGRGLAVDAGIIEVVDGIPRDVSGPNQAGFRLPLVNTAFVFSQEGRSSLSEDDFEIIEVGDDDEEVVEVAGRSDLTRDPADCLKPLARSRCRGSLEQWYYNTVTSQCEAFTYGGCDSDSHSNRFPTETDCRQICMR